MHIRTDLGFFSVKLQLLCQPHFIVYLKFLSFYSVIRKNLEIRYTITEKEG